MLFLVVFFSDLEEEVLSCLEEERELDTVCFEACDCSALAFPETQKQDRGQRESIESIEMMTREEKLKSMTLHVELVPFKIEY